MDQVRKFIEFDEEEGAAEAAAMGHFVHVFVDRATGKPAPIPDAIRSALERIKV